FVKSAGSEGLKVNVDLGTIIRNGEALEDVFAAENIPFISHVHISMPGLKVIEPGAEYEKTVELLKGAGYDRYISIEMLDQKAEDIGNVEKTVNYLIDLAER
ncbi:MAG: sugar phosphate isomerase/epimerase, partial [Parasporobacterium sp.]|nr:sugar phosphate isomerase/epimerase [Parasporobacterium sp.]